MSLLKRSGSIWLQILARIGAKIVIRSTIDPFGTDSTFGVAFKAVVVFENWMFEKEQVMQRRVDLSKRGSGSTIPIVSSAKILS